VGAGFADVETLRAALEQWRQLYNTHWLIERHGHRSPAQVAPGMAHRYRGGRRPDLPSTTCQGNAGGTVVTSV